MSDALAQRIGALTAEQRGLLAQRLNAAGSAAAGEIAPPRRAGGGVVPLSFGQERLWFLAQLDAGGALYNVPLGLRLRGALDVEALRAALAAVVARHEALRTGFVAQAGRPVQVVLDQVDVALPLVELDGDRAEAQRIARRLAGEPFDLARAPLLRARLLRLAAQEHLLVLCLHHIVFDGWSLGVLLRELSEHYNAHRADRPPRLPALSIQYADYAVWQRAQLDTRQLREQLAFWQTQLAGAPELLQLPTDRPRSGRRGFAGGRVSRQLPAPLATELHRLAREHHSTLFCVLLAALQAQLARLSGQHDLSIGTPVAGREHPQTEPLIGFFTNTLVLRSQLDPDPTFQQLLQQARRSTLAALDHQTLPFERLVEHLKPHRTLTHTPLFQIVLNLQPPFTPPPFTNLETNRYHIDIGLANFDLTIDVTTHPTGPLDITAEYSSDLFDQDTVARRLEGLESLLAGAVADPGQRLSRLPVMPAHERRRLLVDWNRTQRAFPRERPVHELVAEQARRRPDAPAVIAGGATRTYGELDRRAEQLADALRRLGASPGSIVAVHLARSADLVAGLLAVLKAGAAYLPLADGSPPARTALMLRAAGAHVLVTDSARLSTMNRLGSTPLTDVLVVDGPPDGGALAAPPRVWGIGDIAPAGSSEPIPGRAAVSADDPAYVIFTSGSTGAPRAVLLRHRPVVNTIDWVNRTFAVGPGDRLLFVTSPTFDLSVYDIFGVLAAGASIRIASDAELDEPTELVRILREEPITFWDSAPAALGRLVPFFPQRLDIGAALRLAFLSGDWIPIGLPDALRAAFPRTRVVALGGATEAAIWSNYYEVDRHDPAWPSIPYGRPIQNARYHVLDQRLEPMPVGVPGALYIGGECLASGYVGETALTAERFVPDPFGADPGARLYRTGDRARYRADGRLEFLGRLDGQLKIRGYRVEPGEIESALRAHAQVDDALVAPVPGPDGSPRLVAYVVPADAAEPPAPDALAGHLRDLLPPYMHPSLYETLDRLPLTANGKIDRRRLPRPAPRKSQSTAPPRTPTERRIAAIWERALAQRPIGVDDNFFELGGHSLLAAEVTWQVADGLGVQVPLRALFESETLAAFAARVDELAAGARAVDQTQIPAHPRERRRIDSHSLIGQVPR